MTTPFDKIRERKPYSPWQKKPQEQKPEASTEQRNQLRNTEGSAPAAGVNGSGGVWYDPKTGEQVDYGHMQSNHPDIVAAFQNSQLAELAEESAIDYGELAKYQGDTIREIAAANMEVMPGLVDQAGQLALSIGKQLNPQIAKEYYQYLSNLNPNWKADSIGIQRSGLMQVSDYANQLMSGKLPQDIINQTMDNMAELGFSKGQFGGLARSNVARNLGLTSLQLRSQGAQLLTDAVSPLSARLLSTTQSLMPPVLNTGAVWSNLLGYTAGGSMGSAQTGQTGVIQASQANADMAFSAGMSAFNAQQDSYMIQRQLRAEKEQRRAQAAGIVAGVFSGS